MKLFIYTTHNGQPKPRYVFTGKKWRIVRGKR